MKARYLLFARSGHELVVADDLALIGCDVWCGKVLEGKPDPKRAGRKRATVWCERPALPNYIFAKMTAEQFYAAKNIKHLAKTITLVPWSSERGLIRFQDRVDAEYQKARAAQARGEQAPPQFDAGQALEAIGGPLAGLVVRFRQIVEDAEGFHVEVDTDMGRVKMNPAHVKRAT
jgi:transcription antitermination factor NusG